MRFKLIISVLIIIIAVTVWVSLNGIDSNEDNFEKNREIILSQLYLAIEGAEKIGKYECCIEPLCTMCYLGDWIWEDGTCDCDGMIAAGEWDKVCPQCIKGIKEGKCKSGIGVCPIL